MHLGFLPLKLVLCSDAAVLERLSVLAFGELTALETV